jgi:hypothetical protein
MNRLLIVVAILGCEAGLQIRPPIPVANVTVAVPVGGAPPGETVATPPEGGGQAQMASGGSSCSGDSQCLAPDDVLICPRAKWDCRVSHTMGQPTEQNPTGTFLQVLDGKQVQTDRWYNTRPLGQGEQLRLGQPVLWSDARLDNRVYFGPSSHDQALKARWTFGAVTDLSELPRGIVHVEENMAHVSNIRVITNGGTQTPPP